MFAKHPDIAKRWSDEYSTPENLPERKSKPASGAMESMKRFLSGQYGSEKEQKRLKPPTSAIGARG